MAKPQSEAPIRLPSAAQVKALLKEGARVKERVGEIAGAYGDRVKSAIENGNLHGAAFGKAKSISNKARLNELAALEQIAHLRVYLDWIEEDIRNKGHVGNLDDQAKAAASGEAKTEPAPEPVDPNTITAPGGLPHDESLRRFEESLTKAANQKKASKVLDIPALDPDAPPAPPAPPAATEAAPVEKPKRGRPKAAAAKADAPPAPPPAAVGGLPDDDEEDLRPAFLRQREEERKSEAVH